MTGSVDGGLCFEKQYLEKPYPLDHRNHLNIQLTHPLLKTGPYFFHITSSDGKVYYWPETFKDYQSARVFNDIKTAFGDSASIDHSANEGLKSFFEPARSNVIAFNFAARA